MRLTNRLSWAGVFLSFKIVKYLQGSLVSGSGLLFTSAVCVAWWQVQPAPQSGTHVGGRGLAWSL